MIRLSHTYPDESLVGGVIYTDDLQPRKPRFTYASCEGGTGMDLFFYFKIVKIVVSIKTRDLLSSLIKAR
jgi:hypothetical protein